ncbi:cytochrome aa3 quinol oxidase subunit II [Sporolactobacillus pectinivorans]|uniref:cytochrome aa3 quinol oxidase subunit II n=1 Tax=Sporolactobacillus pectinivorans TaxID=1591408 RepID=UPI000C269FDC|nr:cytochrome aa3 quinol oxidase subunit II [Sporolactobacillus pectinivorans]
MKKTFKMKRAALLLPLLALLAGCSDKIVVLNPQGPVAREQYHLIVWSLIMMSLVLAIVLIIFIYVLVRFGRKRNAGYDPNDTGNRKLEVVWLIVPVLICILLAVPTVRTLFALNQPPKATAAAPAALNGSKTLTIDVTSVQWKWLFRYPDQKIETVNYVVIPAGTPVKFQLHAYDAMNAFWVPQLGGQQYTMTDMPMKLWLQADKPGNYEGRSSNYSGRDFAQMTFTVKAQSASDFDSWVSSVKNYKPALTHVKYMQLLEPGTVKPETFSSYADIVGRDLNKAQMDALMSGKPVNTDSMPGMNMDNGGKGGQK